MYNNEIWKVIPNFPKYKISNYGRVKSFYKKGKILKSNIDTKGYLSIRLTQEKQRKTVRIHRLVAMCFCDNYAEDKEVHHINFDTTDNRSENLQCLSHEEHCIIHLKQGQKPCFSIINKR